MSPCPTYPSVSHPHTPGSKKFEPCLTWDVMHKRTPWGIILLLGGGVALAEGARESGLSLSIGTQLEGLSDVPKEVLLLLVCLMAGGMTELASNTATASMLLPILANLVCGMTEGRKGGRKGRWEEGKMGERVCIRRVRRGKEEENVREANLT